jgi:NAD(P)H-dependent FMN reductase
MKHILLIEGSTRPEGKSYMGSKWMAKVIPTIISDVEVQVINPNDFDIAYDGGEDEGYTQKVKWADAFIILVPEYNHGYPGKLKSLLDLELKNYIDKPALPVGWSSGGFGGTRGVENIIPVFRELGLIAVSVNFNFSNFEKVFDSDANLIDESYNRKFERALKELMRLAAIFKK